MTETQRDNSVRVWTEARVTRVSTCAPGPIHSAGDAPRAQTPGAPWVGVVGETRVTKHTQVGARVRIFYLEAPALDPRAPPQGSRPVQLLGSKKPPARRGGAPTGHTRAGVLGRSRRPRDWSLAQWGHPSACLHRAKALEPSRRLEEGQGRAGALRGHQPPPKSSLYQRPLFNPGKGVTNSDDIEFPFYLKRLPGPDARPRLPGQAGPEADRKPRPAAWRAPAGQPENGHAPALWVPMGNSWPPHRRRGPWPGGSVVGASPCTPKGRGFDSQSGGTLGCGLGVSHVDVSLSKANTQIPG